MQPKEVSAIVGIPSHNNKQNSVNVILSNNVHRFSYIASPLNCSLCIARIVDFLSAGFHGRQQSRRNNNNSYSNPHTHTSALSLFQAFPFLFAPSHPLRSLTFSSGLSLGKHRAEFIRQVEVKQSMQSADRFCSSSH